MGQSLRGIIEQIAPPKIWGFDILFNSYLERSFAGNRFGRWHRRFPDVLMREYFTITLERRFLLRFDGPSSFYRTPGCSVLGISPDPPVPHKNRRPELGTVYPSGWERNPTDSWPSPFLRRDPSMLVRDQGMAGFLEKGSQNGRFFLKPGGGVP
jgi:hypothetical protein